MLSLFWLHLFYNGWLDSSQNRDSKCLRIKFLLIPLFYDHWAPTLTCFHTFLISNLFAYFHFRSLFPFIKIENFFYHLVYIACSITNQEKLKLKDRCDKEMLLYSNIFKQKIVLFTLNGSYSGTSLSWLFHPVKLYNKT